MSSSVRSFAKRKKFLDALEVGDTPSKAARKAGEDLRFFKSWAKADENFKADWKEAYDQGTDFLEDAATERAIDKSDPLMMFMLKSRNPDKFDRSSKLEITGKINVEGAKGKLLNKLAKLKAQQEEIEEASFEEVKEEAKALPAPGEQFEPRPAVIRGSRRRAKVSSAGNRRPSSGAHEAAQSRGS